MKINNDEKTLELGNYIKEVGQETIHAISNFVTDNAETDGLYYESAKVKLASGETVSYLFPLSKEKGKQGLKISRVNVESSPTSTILENVDINIVSNGEKSDVGITITQTEIGVNINFYRQIYFYANGDSNVVNTNADFNNQIRIGGIFESLRGQLSLPMIYDSKSTHNHENLTRSGKALLFVKEKQRMPGIFRPENFPSIETTLKNIKSLLDNSKKDNYQVVFAINGTGYTVGVKDRNADRLLSKIAASIEFQLEHGLDAEIYVRITHHKGIKLITTYNSVISVKNNFSDTGWKKKIVPSSQEQGFDKGERLRFFK